MRKNVLNILTLSALLGTAVIYAEGRPEISICQANDCEETETVIQQRKQKTRTFLAELAHNDATVMQQFDLLAAELDILYQKGKNLKIKEITKIYDAIDFATDKHRLQTRKNKEKTPYIAHPLGVAYNVIHFGEVKECAVIIGALLHDTVEDTQTTFDEIEKTFEKEVASLVREMTDDKKLASNERKRLQVIEASKKSKGATQIHLADKLYNVVDLLQNPPEGWSRTRIERYYQWVQSVIDRLPQANNKLKDATQKVINDYWEKQESNSKVTASK
jgi:ribosome-associated translation inhibitor RaiA